MWINRLLSVVNLIAPPPYLKLSPPILQTSLSWPCYLTTPSFVVCRTLLSGNIGILFYIDILLYYFNVMAAGASTDHEPSNLLDGAFRGHYIVTATPTRSPTPHTLTLCCAPTQSLLSWGSQISCPQPHRCRWLPLTLRPLFCIFFCC